MDLFFTFGTADEPETSAWSATATALQQRLAAALTKKGFAIDWELGRHEPDWCFGASSPEGETVMVVLVLAGVAPCTWWIGLENANHETLEAGAMREVVHPLVERTVRDFPGVVGGEWRSGLEGLAQN